MVATFKPEVATIAAKLPVDSLSGTLTLDLDFNQGFEFNYAPEAITVPAELANEPETDLDEKLVGILTLMFTAKSSQNTNE